MKFYALVFFVLLLSVFVVGSSVLLKYHLQKFPLPADYTLSTAVTALKDASVSPFAWLALLCSLSGGAVWIYIVNHSQLSIAYSLTSISYLIMLFSGWLFFGEPITTMKVIGIILICLGVAALGL